MKDFVGQSGGHKPIPDELNRASGEIVQAAIEVHRHLGPGLLESVYETAMLHELKLQRLDVLVDPGVVVELKAVDRLLPIHEAQLLSYLKSSGHRVGLLINFNVPVLKRGIRRMVN